METDRWVHHMLNVYTDKEVNGKQGRDYYECKPVFENELTAQIKTHGGADFYAVHYFIQQILGDADTAKYTVDIYKAMDMTLPGILGYRSILAGGAPVEIPNFRIREAREPYRYDVACTDEKVAGAATLPISAKGAAHIPEATYKELQEIWKNSQK